MKPFVSVIIPVHNGGNFIKQCISSIKNQSYPENRYEIIAIDNSSNDNTLELLSEENIICLSESIKGPAASRNAGIQKSRGEILLFIDVDCIADYYLIENHVNSHEIREKENPSIQIIGGAVEGVNGSFWSCLDDFCSWYKYHPRLPARLETNHQPTANISMRFSVINSIGVFDINMRYSEDYAFCQKAYKAGYNIFFEPKAIVKHINRLSFKAVLKHSSEWASGDFMLLKNGIIRRREKRFSLLIIFHAYICLLSIGEVLHYCLKARRLSCLVFIPFITIVKANQAVKLFQIDYLMYKQNKLKRR